MKKIIETYAHVDSSRIFSILFIKIHPKKRQQQIFYKENVVKFANNKLRKLEIRFPPTSAGISVLLSYQHIKVIKVSPSISLRILFF